MNAWDLGRCLAVYACAYDPIHVTAQGQKPGLNCACVPLVPLQNYAKNVALTSWVGSRDFYAQIWASKRHHGHMGYMLDADWSRQIVLRSDWLGLF